MSLEQTKRGSIRILTFNDVYSTTPVEGIGGYAELTTLAKQFQTSNSIFTLNGDFLGGNDLGIHFKGKNSIEILNEIGLDLVVLGNHEFDFGEKILEERIKESNFSWLGSNVHYSDDRLIEGVLETKIMTFPIEDQQIRIGFFGLCTTSTPHLSHPTEEVKFDNWLPIADQMVRKIRSEGVDLIIALTHGTIIEDQVLARKVNGIDLILGGHDHHPIAFIEGNTIIFKAGESAKWLGVIDYEIELKQRSNTNQFDLILHRSWQMLAVRNVEADQKVKSIIEKYQKLDQQRYQDAENLSIIEMELDSRSTVIRGQETRIGNMIADAFANHFEVAQFSLIFAGEIRASRIYPSGTRLTSRDIHQELPFDDHLLLVEIRGRDFLEGVEQQLIPYPEKAGAFPHLSKQLKLKVNPNQPPMSRIIELLINGKPIDLERKYLVAMTGFMSNGGDGCSAFRNHKRLAIGDRPAHVVIDYLRQFQVINVDFGRIEFVS